MCLLKARSHGHIFWHPLVLTHMAVRAPVGNYIASLCALSFCQIKLLTSLMCPILPYFSSTDDVEYFGEVKAIERQGEKARSESLLSG